MTGPGSYDTANPDNTVSVVGAGRDRTVVTSPTSTATDYWLDLRNAATLSDLTLKQFIPAVTSQRATVPDQRHGRSCRESSSQRPRTAAVFDHRHGAPRQRRRARHTSAISGTIEDSEFTRWTARDRDQRHGGPAGSGRRRPLRSVGQNRSLVISSSLFVSTDPNGTVASFSRRARCRTRRRPSVISNVDIHRVRRRPACVGVEISGATSRTRRRTTSPSTTRRSRTRSCATARRRCSRDSRRPPAPSNVKVFNSDIDLSPRGRHPDRRRHAHRRPGRRQPQRRSAVRRPERVRPGAAVQLAARRPRAHEPRLARGVGDRPEREPARRRRQRRRRRHARHRGVRVPAPRAGRDGVRVGSDAPPVGQAVTFTGSATESDPGETVTGLAWRFDDGGAATGTDAPHAFATAGKHTATLTATDSAGATGDRDRERLRARRPACRPSPRSPCRRRRSAPPRAERARRRRRRRSGRRSARR